MAYGYCRNCTRTINPVRDPYCAACRPREIASATPTKSDGLVGGRWVLVGGIKRWMYDPTIHRKWWGLPECETCGAQAGTECRRPSGQTAMEPHACRIDTVSRCACGTEKKPSAKRCEKCAKEAQRAVWRRARAAYLAKQREKAAA